MQWFCYHIQLLLGSSSPEPSRRSKRLTTSLPPALTTCARNKDQHPGVSDQPNPRRSLQEAAAEREATQAARLAKELAHQAALRRVVEAEERMKVVESGRTEDIGTGGGDKAKDGKQQFSSVFHG